MLNYIAKLFEWATVILKAYLNTEIMDGYTFLHIHIFLFVESMLITFIIMIARRHRKNDKSE